MCTEDLVLIHPIINAFFVNSLHAAIPSSNGTLFFALKQSKTWRLFSSCGLFQARGSRSMNMQSGIPKQKKKPATRYDKAFVNRRMNQKKSATHTVVFANTKPYTMFCVGECAVCVAAFHCKNKVSLLASVAPPCVLGASAYTLYATGSSSFFFLNLSSYALSQACDMCHTDPILGPSLNGIIWTLYVWRWDNHRSLNVTQWDP